MDTKTRIYAIRATKVDEVNIIANFRAPRNTCFTSLKSAAYIRLRSLSPSPWFILPSYLIAYSSRIDASAPSAKHVSLV